MAHFTLSRAKTSAQGVIHYFNPHYLGGNQTYESITPKLQYSIPPRE